MAFGEPLDVIQLNTIAEPALAPEEVLVSMGAASLNPSDFLLVRGMYAVRPPLSFSLGAEGVGRVTKTGPKVGTALLGKRVVIVPNYEQGSWSDEVVVPARNTVPVDAEADPLQLAMIGINPAIACLLHQVLRRDNDVGRVAAGSRRGVSYRRDRLHRT